MNVFSFAISRPPKSVETFFADYNINRETDIDYFLIHQANKMIVDRIVKKLKLPKEKVPYNLEEFGNLGGASIPSLMVTRIADQLRTKETTLLMSSFGLGLSWGTMWMKTKPMVISEMVIMKRYRSLVKNNKYNDNYRNKSSNLEIVDKVFISSLFTDNIQNGYRERCDDFS